MSDYRHFQHADGWLHSTTGQEFIEKYAARPEFTEVQVVPLDAEVVTHLPEVQTHEYIPNSVQVDDVFLRFDGAEEPVTFARRRLRQWAAIVRYLREHPPVDEAQVEALAKELRAEHRGVVQGGATWEYIVMQAQERGRLKLKRSHICGHWVWTVFYTEAFANILCAEGRTWDEAVKRGLQYKRRHEALHNSTTTTSIVVGGAS